jgi:hypothetical protein
MFVMKRKSTICFLFSLLIIALIATISHGQDCKQGYPHVPKKDGTFDDRKNDLWELAQDWVHFRNKILQCNAKGDQKCVEKARRDFNQTNKWLNEYSDKHVSEALSLAEECVLKR